MLRPLGDAIARPGPSCHTGTGFPGAPKLGDEFEWALRLDASNAGLEGLLDSVVNGKGGMPPFAEDAYPRAELLEAVKFLVGEED